MSQGTHRRARKDAAIIRALESARSAYPDSFHSTHVREAARQARVSVARVQDVISAQPDESPSVTDWQDYDPNRWNLH